MSTTPEVVIPIKVTDNGTTAKLNTEAQKLNKSYEQVKRTAGQTTAVKSAPKYVSSASDPEKGMGRGATGVGGGNDSKDFARQAQGLGGLVHVYATFAANIFAVTAAFTALKKAADYTNMVEGLNQLGAASGKNLGTMAKGIVEVTDYAVSLKEAMEATAQTTSAGMSSEQVSRLAKVAKQTAQALGRDVGDSLSRLSRGISKIEPELLDELGIMVRVDKAARDYALSLGKTASALTDFEKRQAFAIAVLEQGEKKFGKINIDSNPFVKLEASFVNLLYKGGVLITTVLGPIARVLAESPTALSAVIAGFSGMLLSKAIPALSQWRGGLTEAAKTAAETATRLSAAHESFKINKDIAAADVLAEPIKRKSLDTLAGIQTALANSFRKGSKLVAESMADDFKPAEEHLKKYETEYAKSTSNLNKLDAERNSALHKGNTAVLSSLDKQITKEKERQANIQLSVNRTKEFIDLEKQHAEIYDKTGKDPGRFSEEAMHKRIADAAEKKSNRLNVISSVSDNVKTMGFFGAMEKLDQDIVTKGEKINKHITKIQGRAIGAITSVTTFISSIGNLFAYAAIAMAAYGIVDTIFSKNTKQVEEFSKALDLASDNVSHFKRTLDYIKDSGTILSTENVVAFATAIDELAVGMTSLVTKFKEVKQEASGWDNFKNGLADLFNLDAERNLAEKMAANITSLRAGLTNSKDQDAVNKALSAAGIQDTSFAGIKKAIDTLANDGNITIIDKIAKDLRNLTKEFANGASNLKGFENAAKAADTQMQTLITSFLPSDNFSKFGITQIDSAFALAKAIEDPKQAIVALTEIVEDFNKLKIMPASMQANLLANKDSIIELNATLKAYDDGIRLHQQTLAELEKDKPKIGEEHGHAARVTETKTNISTLESLKAPLNAKIEGYQQLAKKLDVELYDAGARKLKDALVRGMEESSINLKKALVSSVGGIEGAILGAKLDNRLIDVQIKAITTQEALIIETAKLRLAYELQTTSSKLEEEQKKEGTKDYNPTLISKLKASYASSFAASNILSNNSGNKLINAMGDKNLDTETKLKLGEVNNSLLSTQAAKNAKAGEQQQNIVKRDLAIIKEVWKLKTEINNSEAESNSQKLEELKLQTSSNGMYDSQLEMEKARLSARNDELKIANEEIKLLEIQTTTARILDGLKGKGNEANRKLVEDRSAAEEKLQKEAIKRVKGQSKTNSINTNAENMQRFYAAERAELELVDSKYNAITDAATSYNSILEESGLILQSNLLDKQKEISITKLNNQLNTELLGISEKITDAQLKGQSTDLLTRQASRLVEINKLKTQQLEIESKYQKTLVETEETLRSMEKMSINNPREYLSVLTDDFNNKLGQMVKAAKSAGDTFNQGLITAVDNTIDKFFDAMQKSELTWKSMVTFARNALSDVFRDTASQLMKNLWKDVTKELLGESPQERAAREAMEATKALTLAIQENTSIQAGKSDGIAKVKEAGDVQLETSRTVQTGFGLVIDKLTSGMGSFGSIIKSLGFILVNFMSNLSISGAMAGASSGSGILGTIGGFFKGLLSTNGGNAIAAGLPGAGHGIVDGATALAAKGGVFSGSPSLSAYSNSIVSSPTMFAFAKGAGLMGEAGPEVIMPLKRDSSGNLGIRGGGSTNNISININIEQGQVRQDQGTKNPNNMAQQLGNIIKATVTDELIRQSRPGGLLAR